MIGNKPAYSGLIQWSWDYFTLAWDGVLFLETYTFYAGGTYDETTATYSDGSEVGYVYLCYTDGTKSLLAHGYGKRA